MFFTPCCCAQADQDETSITVADTVKGKLGGTIPPADLPTMCIADEGHGYVEVGTEDTASILNGQKPDVTEEPMKMVEAAPLRGHAPETTPEVEIGQTPRSKDPSVSSPGHSRPERGSENNERASEDALQPGPEEFTVTLQPKSGESMGADLAHGIQEDTGLVRIRAIKPEGLFAKWNKDHPDKLIQVDLYISHLNGKPMEVIEHAEMIRLFRAAKVEVSFMRKKPLLRQK
mmetsp:Transcript_12520/g.23096  ORF Transcript_12520/g.23096 Transcript_12520/m.23096 type:complete len:231 (-) Transcript_12520:88-780(-)